MLNEFAILLNIQIPAKHAENPLIGRRLDVPVSVERPIDRSQEGVTHPLVGFRQARLAINVGEATFRTTEIAFGSIHIRIHVIVRGDHKRLARKGVTAPEAGNAWGIGRLDRKLGH
jgi:hypothetical protein